MIKIQSSSADRGAVTARLLQEVRLRLAIRFAIFVVAGMCVVYALAAILRVQREIGLARQDIVRNQRNVGEDLATAVATIWTLAGHDQAFEFIRQANETKGDIDIQIRADQGHPADPTPETRRDPNRLSTSIPVVVNGSVAATLDLSQSLAEESAYIERTIRRTLITTGITILVTGAITIALGLHYVGRPVRDLVRQSRRIAEGDLSGRLEISQRDEFATLAHELNAMCARLHAASERVAHETAARAAAFDQLRHADRLTTVGHIASGIAHELGTPLSVIHARAKMIASGEAVNDEASHSAAVILKQSERMTGIIRQLLNYARRQPARKGTTGMQSLVRETMRMLEPIAKRSGIELILSDDDAALRAFVDPEQVQQALTNIMINGIHAMPNGGALLVEVSSYRETSTQAVWIRIDIRDSGQGIPPDQLERVLEPFFSTKGVDGTGLGLPIALEIVREHGGRIDLASTPGAGTCVSVHLPMGAD